LPVPIVPREGTSGPSAGLDWGTGFSLASRLVESKNFTARSANLDTLEVDYGRRYEMRHAGKRIYKDSEDFWPEFGE
jgi:hypothetical protein